MISLGPFTIPLPFIVTAAVLAAAVLAARIPLRRHRLLRSRVTDRLLNAILIFAVVWKLTPAVLHPADLLRDPLPLLMAAPGWIGAAAGAAAGAAYLAASLLRRRGLRRAAILPLGLFVAVAVVGIGAVQAASFMPLISSRPAGPPAPALVLPTLDGTGVSLQALRGRVVVVNFWATWCPPCRAELPGLAAFARSQAAGGADGGVLIGVNATSTETSERAVRAFAEEHGVDFPVALDRTGDVTRAWDVRAWPTTVVVAPDGTVMARRTGAVDAGWLRREVWLAKRVKARAPRESPGPG